MIIKKLFLSKIIIVWHNSFTNLQKKEEKKENKITETERKENKRNRRKREENKKKKTERISKKRKE